MLGSSLGSALGAVMGVATAVAEEQAQPAQDAIAQTLKERGERYGEFRDVARLTQSIYNQLVITGTNGPALRDKCVQAEALHMICSKLARIACGDPDYADSWRDIAGYATLVVNELEGKK